MDVAYWTARWPRPPPAPEMTTVSPAVNSAALIAFHFHEKERCLNSMSRAEKEVGTYDGDTSTHDRSRHLQAERIGNGCNVGRPADGILLERAIHTES